MTKLQVARHAEIQSLTRLALQVNDLDAERSSDPLSSFIGELVVARADVLHLIDSLIKPAQGSPPK